MADAELERLRQSVDCRLILERAGWQLDAKESTRLAAKYRSGPGRIVIVTHDGGGWFDPLGESRGDAIALAQFVWGGNLGHARKALRPLAGLSPEQMSTARQSEGKPSSLDARGEWARKSIVRKGSPAWRYLTDARQIPVAIVSRAAELGLLREGYNATALMGQLLRRASSATLLPCTAGRESLARCKTWPVFSASECCMSCPSGRPS